MCYVKLCQFLELCEQYVIKKKNKNNGWFGQFSVYSPKRYFCYSNYHNFLYSATDHLKRVCSCLKKADSYLEQCWKNKWYGQGPPMEGKIHHTLLWLRQCQSLLSPAYPETASGRIHAFLWKIRDWLFFVFDIPLLIFECCERRAANSLANIFSYSCSICRRPIHSPPNHPDCAQSASKFAQYRRSFTTWALCASILRAL